MVTGPRVHTGNGSRSLRPHLKRSGSGIAAMSSRTGSGKSSNRLRNSFTVAGIDHPSACHCEAWALPSKFIVV
jgi:hypothetical protein